MEQDLTRFLELAKSLGAHDAKLIDPATIVTAAWVRMKCQFGCAGYGKTLCCPPHTPTPDEMRRILDSYTDALLLHIHWNKDYKMVNRFNDTIVDLERTIFLDGYYKTWAVGSGPCDRCKECNLSDGCRNTDKARPSMESCGIDVFQTARNNGFFIKTLSEKSETQNLYCLMLVD
mgnify:CR=1 FL=1